MSENPSPEALQRRIKILEREALEAKRFHEERVVRLNTMLRTARNLRQLIGKEKGHRSLLQFTCDTLTENRGYHHVWAALLDDSGKVVFTAESGLGEKFLPLMEMLKRGELPFCFSNIIKKQDFIFIEDPASTCMPCPLARMYNGEGAMAVREMYAGKVYGLISACMPKKIANHLEEQTLFREIADDVAYALFSIESKKRRQKAEASLKETLDIVNRSPIAIFLWENEEGWPVRFVSGNVVHLLGYTAEELMSGRITYTAVVHPDDLERVTDEVVRQSAQKGVQGFRHDPYRVITKGGDEKYVSDLTSFRRDSHGEITHYEGILHDVTELVRQENRIKSSLKEKETLLKEIHHRVKNNMNVTSSLLKLQASGITDPKLLEMLKDTRNRIKTMALIHDKLYRSKNLTHINFQTYVQDLVETAFKAYGAGRDGISLKVAVEELFFEIDLATPCALMISELLSNAFKHAFPGNQKGEIEVSLRSINNDELELTVSDDGVGFSRDFDFENSESFGLYIVNLLVEQLEGAIALNRDGGTSFRIRFKK